MLVSLDIPASCDDPVTDGAISSNSPSWRCMGRSFPAVRCPCGSRASPGTGPGGAGQERSGVRVAGFRRETSRTAGWTRRRPRHRKPLPQPIQQVTAEEELFAHGLHQGQRPKDEHRGQSLKSVQQSLNLRELIPVYVASPESFPSRNNSLASGHSATPNTAAPRRLSAGAEPTPNPSTMRTRCAAAANIRGQVQFRPLSEQDR